MCHRNVLRTAGLLLFVLSGAGPARALTTPAAGAYALPSDVDLRLPFASGETCRIAAAYNGAGSSLHVDTDRTDKANEYYSIDFVLPAYPNNGLGQPVLASLPGTVVLAGWATAGWANYGQRVTIRYTHTDGHTYTMNYCHLNAIYVTVGQTVAQGDIIGELGDSCDGDNQQLSCPSFAPHLHTSLHRDSNIGGTGTGGSYGGNAVVPEPWSGYEDLGIGLDLISNNNGQPLAPCQIIQPVVTVLEDNGPCFRRFGPSQYWHDETTGHDGSCVWTYTIDQADPDNYVAWNLHFAQAGDYALEAYVPASFGQSVQAAYVVQAAGVETTVTVSQAAYPDGWAPLGTFAFDAGGDQWVQLADNTGEPYVSSTENTQIVFDAIRVSPVGTCECAATDAPETRSCERCGTQTRSCDGCTWPDWSTVACEDQGECEAGAAEHDAAGCSDGTARERTCSLTCSWESWSECQTVPPDAGTPDPDGGIGTDGGAPPNPSGSGGCGCTHSHGPSGVGWLLLLVALFWRRRWCRR